VPFEDVVGVEVQDATFEPAQSYNPGAPKYRHGILARVSG
jgi:hypothetical protein